MKYNDVSMKNQYNERMTSRISTESLLSSAMVAYHLKKDYKNGSQIEILANFPYQEDNPYFAEKYLKQEYFDGDDEPASYWGTTYMQDRRDEEIKFLRRLFKSKIIKDFSIWYGEEDDPVRTGVTYKQPKQYGFTTTDKYIPTLELFMQLADARIIRTKREKDTESTPDSVNKKIEPSIDTSESTIPKKVILHLLEPEHYNKRTGVLYLSPTDKVAIAKRGNARKPNGQKFEQCNLLGQLFKNVNTLKNGVKASKILGVHEHLYTKKHDKKIRNLLQEINDKVTAVGGPNNLVRTQNQKVFINSSYLA